MTERVDADHIKFRCPGCGDTHVVDTRRWKWNGSHESPSLSPSLLVRSGHHAPQYQGDECWCTFGGETRFSCYVCHSFVTNGSIRFLRDSTHHLAGKTVPLGKP